MVTIFGTLSIYEAYSLMLTNRIRHHVVAYLGGKLLGLYLDRFKDVNDTLGYKKEKTMKTL